MDEYVVEVDANFPSGAQVVIPKIRAITRKPIRFVVDTHFHPDHSSGNETWVRECGSVVVAQAATLDRLRLSGAAIWALQARTRPDIAASRLHLPDVSFLDTMAFEDSGHRVELRYLGPAHTDGDALVWLPRERILFTGDVCVNGSYNFLHDGHLVGWIGVLNQAAGLGPRIVCPCHGPRGGPEILADQARYFGELLRGVRSLVDSGDTLKEAESAGPGLAGELRAIPAVSRYVPTDYWFRFQVEKAYSEITGRPLAD
jgi:cyclase